MRKPGRAVGRLTSRIGVCLVAAAAGIATLAAPAVAAPSHAGVTEPRGMMPADSPDAVTTHVATASLAGTQAAAVAVPLGVDVSDYNGAIDWAKVAASGQKFAVIKATQLNQLAGPPVLNTNPRLASNVAGAHAQGLVVGTYAYVFPQYSATDQADEYAAALASLPGGGLPAGSLPPTIDLEEDDGLSVPALQAWTHAFLDRLQSDTGILPMIYTGPSFWAASMGGTTDFANYPLWEANWTDAAQPHAMGGWSTYALWQFADDATVAGITGVVDHDRFNSATGATLSNLHMPTGSLESVKADGTGALTVSGWTVDPDTPSTPTRVAIYVDGHGTALTADGSRPDIATRLPLAGTQHGFSRSFQVAPGAHQVSVYVIDTSSTAVHALLGSVTANVVPHLPTGAVESATADGTGRLTVSGWTMDSDTPTTPTRVAIYVDGHGTTITADGSRPDIGARYPQAGSLHGFTDSFQVAPGAHQVCVYAIDTSFSGLHTNPGCRTLSVVPHLPSGHLDAATVDGAGLLTVRGWTMDPDTPTTPTRVAVYVDGHGHMITADGSRPDIAAHFPQAGSLHGFSTGIQVGAGSHQVCVYAIDTSFSSMHTALRCVTVS